MYVYLFLLKETGNDLTGKASIKGKSKSDIQHSSCTVYIYR